MRLHSTTESVKACEFTWLAVAECVVSTALYVAFACYRHTFRYYALAIALAPLALLRTDAAVDWALHRYSGHSALGARMLREREYYAKWSPARLVPYAFLLFVLLLVWGFIYRVFSVGYWFLRQPLHAIRQVPKNWLRQALCVDLFSPPEIVPGEDAYKSELKFENQFGEMIQIPVHSSMPTFRKVFLHQKDPAQEYMEKKLGIRPEVTPWTWQIFVIDYVFKSLLFVPAFLVSVAYRVSLKATCVVYAPFVWVAGFTAGSTDPLKMRLERITKQGRLKSIGDGLQ